MGGERSLRKNGADERDEGSSKVNNARENELISSIGAKYNTHHRRQLYLE